MTNELPLDFHHEPPQGYRYEVIRKNASVLAIWTVCNPGFVYNDGNDVRCIWGFYNTKKGTYHAPINSTKVGNQVDIESTTPYSAMQLNLNPLEYALYSSS
tara:strand:+ start:269 stop:571 length:303 start_codon:yes stop_codon:yes gene_type:complete